MKFIVTMKDPDGPYDSVPDAVKAWLVASGLPAHEQKLLEESRREELDAFKGQWMEFGEYVSIEFDTDAGTATVLPAKRD